MSRNKLPQHIIGAIRRRAAAYEKYFLANRQIHEYCEANGINMTSINGHVEVIAYVEPNSLIHEIEERLAKKSHE